MVMAEILATQASIIRALVTQRRAARPRLFGSVLHGTDRAQSDVDILVDPLPGATLFDLGGLQMDLEELLGRRVDLLTPNDIAPHIRTRVLSEARPI